MIYIQANKEGLPHHHECACAMYGAIENDEEFILVTYEQLTDINGKWDWRVRNHLFVGTVEFMKEVWKIAGVKPWIPNNPSRPSVLMTLGEAKDKVKSGTSIFIKPRELKLFTGFVLDESHYTCLDGISDDTLVLTCNPFKKTIVSEWRVYIKDSEIIDCRNYSGEFDVFPDMNWVKRHVDTYRILYNKESWNRCYTMDIAIFEDDSQEIIELNDMWAIGNYGVPNDIYLDLLERRYSKIIKDVQTTPN